MGSVAKNETVVENIVGGKKGFGETGIVEICGYPNRQIGFLFPVYKDGAGAPSVFIDFMRLFDCPSFQLLYPL